MITAIEQFRSAIINAGLTPPEHIVADGVLHRFGTNGKADDKSGWYCLHGDGMPAGGYGCWRSDISGTWNAGSDSEYSQAEKAEHAARMRDIKVAREAEDSARKSEAKKRAGDIWSAARPAPDDHAYLKAKNVKAHGLRVSDGRLIVPLCDASGEIKSLQIITADGAKKFLPGGHVSGSFYLIGEPRDTILLSEGFATGATLHEATGHAVVVAFNAGNLEPVARAIRQKYPKARLTICADDDNATPGNPGLSKARAAAAAVGAAIAVPDFGPDRPDAMTDFNDLHRLHGLDAVREQIARASKERRNDRLLWLADIRPQLSAPWTVSRVLPRTGLALIFGESGSGKTYLATDVALHVAAGMPWCGRAVHGGTVIYVASESPSSVQNRVSLWARERGRADIPFAVVPRVVDLLSLEAVADLIQMIAETVPDRGPLAAIFLDTLARSIPGADENAARDMGGAIAACDRIRQVFGTLVCLIHHAGKDAQKGARGHSSLRAAVDTEIFVEANSGRHVATITKQRDDSAGARFEFRLEPHVLGTTDDGEHVSACLVADLSEASEPPKTHRDHMTASERIAMDALHEVLGDRNRRRVSFDSCIQAGAALDQYMAAIEDWRQRFYERRGGDAGANKKAFQRVRESLQAKRQIQCFEDFAWLSS